jgi:hypothetical protein
MSVLARAKLSFRAAPFATKAERANPRGSNGRQGFEPELQFLIGEQLRSFYADLLREPVPERLLNLIDRLNGAEGERS